MGTYATLADIRDENVTPKMVNDARVLMLLERWARFVDHYTKQWFEERALTVPLEGTDCNILWFPVPIIAITSLKLNGDTNALDPAAYTVHNSRDLPDDRRNPRISLGRNSSGDYSIFTSTTSTIFMKGYDQVCEGTFGYTEPDGSTPQLIIYAVKKLVIADASGGKLITVATSSKPSGLVKQEKTDGHSITYDTPKSGEMSAFALQDKEVLDILSMFKAPIYINAPTGRVY